MPVSRVRKGKTPAYTPPPSRSAANQPPSAPWVGWVIVVLLLLAVAWIVTYTLGPAPLQDSLGSWNYVVAIVLAVSGVVMLTRWR